MKVIQNLYIPIQLQRSALPLGLLHTQAGDVILEFIVD
jgi:hypothetical protein